LIGGAACASKSESEPLPPDAAVQPAAPRPDAAELMDPVTDDDAGPVARRPRAERPKPEMIQIILRSSPPGSIAAVDGVVIGKTPTYWQGEKIPTPREFTFVRRGYAMARYRFVPIKDGVVHATLKSVMVEKDDATPD
jgi:hypothetical protein